MCHCLLGNIYDSYNKYSILCFQTRRHGSGLGNDSLNLSQDNLDDNIGVDLVMCHSLLGNICDSYNKYSIFVFSDSETWIRTR